MPATALVTSEQFLALPEEFDRNGNRIKDELIGGEIVKMPPASRLHDRIKNRISRILARYLDQNSALNLDTVVEMGAKDSDRDTFIPDVIVASCNRLDEEGRIFRGSPELAIEVVSPHDTAAHLKRKVDTYLKGGSIAVWVVYPESKSVMVYSGDTAHELKGDQKIEVTLLPGFSTPVSAFF